MEQLLSAIRSGDKRALTQVLAAYRINLDSHSALGNTPLGLACLRGDIEAARLLIDKGASVNFPDRFNRTPLMNACLAGSSQDALEIVKMLMRMGADHDAVDFRGDTALTLARRNDSKAVADFLSSVGAKQGAASNVGDSPVERLMSAIRTGDMAQFSLILSGYAGNLDVWTSSGLTPLGAACMRGEAAMARALLDKGASVAVSDRHHKTPLIYACMAPYEYQALETARILLFRGANPIEITYKGESALALAKKRHFQRVVDLFSISSPGRVAAGNVSSPPAKGAQTANAPVDNTAQGPNEALFSAINSGRVADIREALLKGADVNSANSAGRSPLMEASAFTPQGKAIDMVRLLLDKGADIDATDRQGFTPLAWAAQKGSAKVVALLLDQGAKVDAKDAFGRTPLMKAASTACLSCVRALIEKGADPNLADDQGKTALDAALAAQFAPGAAFLSTKDSGAAQKHATLQGSLKERIDSLTPEGIKKVLEETKPADLAGKVGVNLLCSAIRVGSSETVEALLEKGVKSNGKDDDGLTPLMRAAEAGRPDIVKVLLEKRAEVNAGDDRGRSPLFYAVEANAADSDINEIIEMLVKKGARINARDKEGLTPLTVAIRTGDIHLVLTLLEKRADPNLRDKDGLTPLAAALAGDDLGLIKTLLEKGANANFKDKEGRTPLMNAIAAGKLELVKTLIEAGVELNAKDKFGRTALIRAVLAQKPESVDALLEKKLDLEAKTQDGLSALMLACGYRTKGLFSTITFNVRPGEKQTLVRTIGDQPDEMQDGLPRTLPNANLKIVESLLKKGADPNTKDKNGITPLMIACGYRPSNPSEKENKPFQPAWGPADVQLAKILLDHKADAKAKDRDGVTPLLVACGLARTFREVEGNMTNITISSRPPNIELAQLLLERGASLEAKEKQGVSPFLAACMKWNDQLIQLLLDHKADIEVKCGIGATPLHWTAHNGRLPAVEGLIARGANVNAKSNDGKTPLISACANGHTEAARVLLNKGARTDAKNNRGMTPLICAAEGGHLAVVRLLLERGADASVRDYEGKTALARAKEKERLPVVWELEKVTKK
jgi:ankyrin repeat protein